MKKFSVLLCVVCFGFFTFPAPNSLAQTNSIGAASSKVELVLGNPSGATADASNDPNNFLLVHNSFILSYNRTRGAANWVTWHLSAADIGDVDRTNAFAPDTALPKDFWIRPSDYVGSGYDRGHLCPSKDRSDTEANNRETFLMSNMQPQSPKLNQKTWKYLEDYSRDLAKNNEEYIYAGCYGESGRIKDKITIPTNCYKIIVVLAEGENDLKRINRKTRIIAVDMPNDATVSSRWRTYLTTVDDIEEKTGYDFLSTITAKIQAVIEAKKDTN
jgi:endonuclease G